LFTGSLLWRTENTYNGGCKITQNINSAALEGY